LKIKVSENTNIILLNALTLTFQDCHVLDSHSNKIECTNTELITDDERVKFTLAQELIQNNEYTVKIQYSGVINEKLKGFYKSVYTDLEGNKK